MKTESAYAKHELALDRLAFSQKLEKTLDEFDIAWAKAEKCMQKGRDISTATCEMNAILPEATARAMQKEATKCKDDLTRSGSAMTKLLKQATVKRGLVRDVTAVVRWAVDVAVKLEEMHVYMYAFEMDDGGSFSVFEKMRMNLVVCRSKVGSTNNADVIQIASLCSCPNATDMMNCVLQLVL